MITTVLNLLDKWHLKKKSVAQNKKTIFIKEREILFVNMGQNIGVEQDGKGDEFLRPVIVYKKFNNSMFLGIPLTSTLKDSIYYYNFEFKSKTDGFRKSSAILSQVKAYDVKRVKFKLGTINKQNFMELHERFLESIRPKDILTPRKSEESPEGICSNIVSKEKKEVK